MLFTRFIAIGGAFVLSAHALSVTHHDARALHARHEARDAPQNESLVEKSDVSTELEARGSSQPVGLAWTGNLEKNLKHFVTHNTKYIYTWSPWCPSNAKELNLECCPMLWGTKQISTFQQQKYKGGKCIMGMNEVNVPSQGMISVAEGIKLWNQYIYPMKAQGYQLISPSVTSGNDGIAWLQQFYAKCGHPNCGATATAMHYYGTSVSDFIKWAQKFHTLGNGHVWLTEMAYQDFGGAQHVTYTKDAVFAFMDGTTSWMKQQSWIQVYFFFGLFQDMYNVNTVNRMVNGDGTPNALGLHYVNS